jgi:hypothetical protein
MPRPIDPTRLPKHFDAPAAEARWDAEWERLGVHRYDPAPRRDVRRRHAAADRVGLAARRPRLQLHAHRGHRPLPAHAGPDRLLPDGIGRQRPAERAPGAELLPRPLRRARPTSRGSVSSPPAARGGRSRRASSRAGTSSSSASRSRARTSRCSREVTRARRSAITRPSSRRGPTGCRRRPSRS